MGPIFAGSCNYLDSCSTNWRVFHERSLTWVLCLAGWSFTESLATLH